VARTRLSAKGQMVLPKRIREQLGWRQGQELEVDRQGDRIVVRAAEAGRGDWLAGFLRWEGTLKGTDALGELEAEHRAEVEADERWERAHGR
jgi:AbrB family looped-hinge helix DNA binding protein